MAWTISKCHRVLRPLTTQLSRYNTIANLTLIENEIEQIKYPKQKVNNSRDCLDNCKAILPIECYERCIAVVNSFEQFLIQCANVKWTLATRSAFHVGQCIVLTQDEFESNEWHAAVDNLGACDKLRQYVCMGNAIEFIVNKSSVLKYVMPALVMVALDQEQFVIAQKLFGGLVDEMNAHEFLQQREWIVRLGKVLKMENVIVKKLTTIDLKKSDYEQELVDLINMLKKLEFTGSNDLQSVVLHLLTFAKKYPGYSMQLVEFVFSRISQPSVQMITRILKKFPLNSSFVALRKVIQLYTNYKHESKWLNITPDDDINELCSKYVAVFRYDNELFKSLTEYVFPVAPNLAVEVSSKYISKYTNDIKTVLWQDELSNRAIKQMVNENDIYDEVMGVWVSTPETSPEPIDTQQKNSGDEPQTIVIDQSKRKRKLSTFDFRNIDTNDAADEFSLIKPAKRRKSSGFFKRHEPAIYDDICLIAV